MDRTRRRAPGARPQHQAEARRVAVERLPLGRCIEELELVEAQDTLVDLSSLLACAYDLDHVAEQRDNEHLNRLGKHRPADDDALLQLTRVHLTPPVPRFMAGLMV